jgi:N-acyl-L-homoserine lactone synthetase
MPANRISNQEVIPEIESSIFEGHEAAHLAVGIVAVGDNVLPGLENEFHGYQLLRGNVYARQKAYMSEEELNSDGTETDVDDSRSVHFAVIENAMNNPRVVAAMRLIVKSPQDARPLPIEEHYPEAFVEGEAGMYSTEVSRLIARHENPKVQGKLKWPLFAAGVSYIVDHQLGPVFGAVEESLEQGLQTAGVPVSSIGEPKFVEEFNATKLPIRIDIPGLSQRLEEDKPDLLDAMQALTKGFVYSGTSRHAIPVATVA